MNHSESNKLNQADVDDGALLLTSAIAKGLGEIYMTPKEPFEHKSRDEHPFQMGDVFNNEKGDEITILDMSQREAIVVMNRADIKKVYIKKYSNLMDIFKEGFKINMEFVKMSIACQKIGLIAPRKLKDGTWAALTNLMFTTAICVDYELDGWKMYESRYCFGGSKILASWHIATYWLAQMNCSMSLPIGNCAFRGTLGNIPIADLEKTIGFYKDLEHLKHYPTIDGLNLQQYAARSNDNHINEENKKIKALISELEQKANLQAETNHLDSKQPAQV